MEIFWCSQRIDVNNYILFFRNKVTRKIKQIAAEHEQLSIEYKIQTETGEKISLPTLKPKQTYFAQTNENSLFTF